MPPIFPSQQPNPFTENPSAPPPSKEGANTGKLSLIPRGKLLQISMDPTLDFATIVINDAG